MIDLFTNDDYYAFICQMRDDPEDDVVRLVCADWLEERGFEERAKYIRWACEQVLMSNMEYAAFSPRASWPDSISQITGIASWSCKYIWFRGFVDEIWMTNEQWVLYGPKICRVHPIQKGHLSRGFGYSHVCLPQPLPDGSNL